MSAPVDVLAPVVHVNGAELSRTWQDQLTGIRIERALGLVGRATLRFADEGYKLSATTVFALGASVRLTVHSGDLLMAGTVTGVSLEQSWGDHPELVVVADDIAYKLTRGTRVRTFLQSTYSDTLIKVLGEAGVQHDVSEIPGSANEYLMQAGTDLAFLDSVVERTGFVWWVEDETVQVRPAGTSTDTVPLELTTTLQDFSVHASALRPDSVSVSGWDPDQQSSVVAQSDSVSPDSDAAFVNPYLAGNSSLGAAKLSATDPHALDADEGKAIATALYSDALAGAVTARGTCFANSKIKPGVTVQISSAGPASGSYLVSRVEHSYTSSGFRTRFVAGSHRPTGLVDTLGRAPSAAGLSVEGVVVGVVTDINDPDGIGRVKVMYAGVDGSVGSPWSRVVTLGAGGQRGVVFQPEVNDEVLVAFERNDPRRPVVIGGLYSKKNTMPTWGVSDNKVAKRRITSRVGHTIELSDGTGDDGYILVTLAGTTHKIRLSNEGLQIQVDSGKPITIAAGSASFEITKQGDVNIAGNNITIKANMALNLESGSEAKLKSEAQTQIQSAMISVKAEAVASVEGGANLALKGGMVMIN